ncbi:MAG TPA: hypothetical protein PLB91_07955 [Spirochaetales bacterium]|nr:hypothetical protein [Spirochaetales bacterium]HRY54985.1 hypothetical protein [Spirochaetia bacterium]
MIQLDPARYLPAPDTLEGAQELARDLALAAEEAAQWLAASLAVQVRPRRGAGD